MPGQEEEILQFAVDAAKHYSQKATDVMLKSVLELTEQFESLTEKYAKYDDVDELSIEIRGDIEKIESAINVVSKTLESFNHEFKEHADTVSNSVESLARDLNQQSKVFDKNLDEIKAEYDLQNSRIKTDVEHLHDLLVEIEVNLKDLSGSVELFEKYRISFDSELKTLKDDILTFDNESLIKFQKLGQDIKDFQEKIDTNLKGVEDQFNLITTSMVDHSNDIADLQIITDSNGSRIESLSNELDAVKTDFSETVELKMSMVKREIDDKQHYYHERFNDKLAEIKIPDAIPGPAGKDGVLDRAVPWTENTLFTRSCLVIHRNGLWQALDTTDKEPGFDKNWQCLTNGLFKTFFRGNNLIITLSDGTEIDNGRAKSSFEGVFDAEKDYLTGDHFIKDGSLFEVISDGVVDQSQFNKHAVMIVQRGQKGQRGKPGPVPNNQETALALAEVIEVEIERRMAEFEKKFENKFNDKGESE